MWVSGNKESLVQALITVGPVDPDLPDGHSSPKHNWNKLTWDLSEFSLPEGQQLSLWGCQVEASGTGSSSVLTQIVNQNHDCLPDIQDLQKAEIVVPFIFPFSFFSITCKNQVDCG